jgi:hypothetical protein
MEKILLVLLVSLVVIALGTRGCTRDKGKEGSQRVAPMTTQQEAE